MKYIILLLVVPFLLLAQANDHTNNGWDTLFYEWEIHENQPELQESWILYNGNIFLTRAVSYSQTYYSKDNFNTWQNISWINKNDDIWISDYCLLPNNNIVVSGNYYSGYGPNGTFISSGIKVYDFENNEWHTYKNTEFKENPVGSIKFRDSYEGILLSRNKLYKTYNGGKDWQMFYEMKDDYILYQTEYFKDNDIFMIRLLERKSGIDKNYFKISYDFGISWSNLKKFPETDSLDQFKSDYDTFFMSNDSIWYINIFENDKDQTNRIYFSPDLGDTWQLQYKEPSNGLTLSSMAFFDNTPCGIVVERWGNRILMTFDYGNNWIPLKDSVTQYGENPSGGDIPEPKYRKFYLTKADNRMIITGENKIFIMNYLGHSTGISDSNKDLDISVYYDQDNGVINFKSTGEKLIKNVDIYSFNGQKLYTDRDVFRTNHKIPVDAFRYHNVIFAVIQLGNQVYFKKVLCE